MEWPSGSISAVDICSGSQRNSRRRGICPHCTGPTPCWHSDSAASVQAPLEHKAACQVHARSCTPFHLERSPRLAAGNRSRTISALASFYSLRHAVHHVDLMHKSGGREQRRSKLQQWPVTSIHGKRHSLDSSGYSTVASPEHSPARKLEATSCLII